MLTEIVDTAPTTVTPIDSTDHHLSDPHPADPASPFAAPPVRRRVEMALASRNSITQ